MFDPKQPVIEPFDYRAIRDRSGKLFGDYLKASFGVGDNPFADPAQAAERLQKFLTDSMEALSEVSRLYGVLDGLKRKHMPHAGEPGAPVVCTSCSMHGGQVPWPCETYKVADAALPEGWPQ